MDQHTIPAQVIHDWEDEDTQPFFVDPRGSMQHLTDRLRDRCTLFQLEGLDAGAVHALGPSESVIGRSRLAAVRLDDPGLSRKHARILSISGELYIEDLGSTNGTFVNGERLSGLHRLRTGDRIGVGRDVVFRAELHDPAEQSAARQLYESAMVDPLTKLYGRRYLDARLRAEHSFVRRHGTVLSLLLLDVDHFKLVNDSLGHAAGDAVLRVLGAALPRVLRAEDVVARYGGEEFCVLLRGIDLRNALIVAERIRRTAAQLTLPWQGRTIHVTVSIGVATMSPSRPFHTVEGLLDAADTALYRAKRGGRNRSCAG